MSVASEKHKVIFVQDCWVSISWGRSITHAPWSSLLTIKNWQSEDVLSRLVERSLAFKRGVDLKLRVSMFNQKTALHFVRARGFERTFFFVLFFGWFFRSLFFHWRGGSSKVGGPFHFGAIAWPKTAKTASSRRTITPAPKAWSHFATRRPRKAC